MGDRHGGCFARRGRALNPPRRGFPMARCGVPMARGGGQDLPARERSPRQKPPETAHERKNLPARERSPRQKPTDTAHGRKDLPRAGTLPRRRPPDTAHGRKDLPRARTLPSAKASRHGARAKGFAQRGSRLPRVPTNGGPPSTDEQPEKHPFGEGLPTRRTSERICPAQKRSPRRRPPDTAHERKDLPRGSSPSPHVPTNGGPPSTDGQPEKHPFGGVAPERARPLPSSFTEKNKTTP